jgi:glycerophosphoryl diester phosphodiesterase
MSRTRIVGHRGCGFLAPENSLTGFRRAVEMKLDGTEFDIHMTKDRALVVLHDPWLERTTSGTGAVGDMTFHDLRGARIHGTDEPIPTMREVLDVLAPSACELHVEIKTDVRGEPYDDIVAAVLDEIRGRHLEERTIFTSFIPEDLHRVRALSPQARVLCSINRTSAEARGGFAEAIAAFAELEGCLFAVEKNLLLHAFDDFAPTLGADRLGVWLVDKAEGVTYWHNRAVRQITTDRPDIAISAIADR